MPAILLLLKVIPSRLHDVSLGDLVLEYDINRSLIKNFQDCHQVLARN